MVDGLWQCFPVPPPSLRTITSACGRAAQVRSFVYGADVVPRLLGSDLPLLTAALERFGNAPQLDEGKHVIETLTEYEHPEHDGTELVYIHPATADARAVPLPLRRQLLHIHQSASLEAVAHHKEYGRGLQRAMTRATRREGVLLAGNSWE